MLHNRVGCGICVVVALVVLCQFLPSLEISREQARRTQTKVHLKMIGLAIHNYHETYNRFPPGGTFDSNDQGYFGWMVAILPYMVDSDFYHRIDFERPWDSPSNAALLRVKHFSYQCPSVMTVGDCNDDLAHFSANSHVFGANSDVHLKDLKSPATTFLVGELGGDFVPWACPYNWRELVSLNAKPATYGQYYRRDAFFLFADGRVDLIADTARPVRLGQMSGENLAGKAGEHSHIIRPESFPCPHLK